MRRGLYIALLFLAMACERTLEISLPDYQEKLVVNTLGNTHEHLTLHLSTNVNLLSDPVYEKDVGELRLVVSESGFVVHDAVHTAYDGSIKTALALQHGKIYRILLSSDRFSIVSATDTMPKVQPDFAVNQLVEIGSRMQLEWTIRDQPEEQRYMLVLHTKGYELVDGDTIWGMRPVPFTTSDPIFISRINSLGSNPHFALFKDQLLQGNSRSFNITFDAAQTQLLDGFYPTALQMELRCLSPGLFNYYLKILENNHVYGGPLASGGYLDGNVLGGLGIFGCYTAETSLWPL